MINPFIKLTGSDGYGNEKTLFLNANQISGYSIESRRNITRVVSSAEIFYATETPEEIAAMIQKYYDKCMLSQFYAAGLVEGKYHTSAIVKNAKALYKHFKDDEKCLNS